MGSHHSLTPCAVTDGTVVSMEHLTRVMRIDHGAGDDHGGSRPAVHRRRDRPAQREAPVHVEHRNRQHDAGIGRVLPHEGRARRHRVRPGRLVRHARQVGRPARRSARGERGREPRSAAPGPIELRALRHHLRSHAAGEADRSRAVHLSAAVRPTSSREAEVDDIIQRSEGLVCWTLGRTSVFQTKKRIDGSRTCSRGSWPKDAGCCGTTSPRSGRARSISSSTARSSSWRRIRPSGSRGSSSSRCR